MVFYGGSMKKKVLLKGPLLTRSGYGEQARFALRSLQSRSDVFDIYIQPLQWGQTSWINEDTPERRWIDHTIEKTIGYIQQNGKFDISIQVTIPNEFENLADYNIGYTAGIETTKVAHQWLIKANEMDKIIVVSEHSKNVFESTDYQGTDTRTNQMVHLKLQTPIAYVNYPTKQFKKLKKLDFDTETDINFLCVAQFGPRKNLLHTIKWFLEEFANDSVGLILKTNKAKNCLMDREAVFMELRSFLQSLPESKAKVYLLHGDMSDEEIHSLYKHPKVSAFLTLAHGEGFGLPIFEAAYTGIPVISPGWSGQLDFLCDENKKEQFYNVAFDIQQVPQEIVWDGVIVKESMWAVPRETSAKEQMRKCYNDIKEADKKKLPATKYAKKLHKRFAADKMYSQFVSEVISLKDIEEMKAEIDDLLSDLL